MPTAIIITHTDHLNAMMYASAKVNQLKCAVLNASNSILKDQLVWICNNSECVKELEANCQKAMHGIVNASSKLTNIPFTSPSFVLYEKGKTLCEESITSGVLGDATCYLETPESNPYTLVQHRCRTYPQEFLPYPCIRYSTKWSNACGEITNQKECSTALGGRCAWDSPLYIAPPSAKDSDIPRPWETVSPAGAPTPWKLVPQNQCTTPTAFHKLLPSTDKVQVSQEQVGEYCRLKNYTQDAHTIISPSVMSETIADYKVPILQRAGIDKGLVDSFLPCTMGSCQVQGKNLCNNLNVENVLHFRVAPNDDDNVAGYFKNPNPYWFDWGNTNLEGIDSGQGGWGDGMHIHGEEDSNYSPSSPWRTKAMKVKPTPGNFQFNPSGDVMTTSDIWYNTFSPTNPEYKGCANSLQCGDYLTSNQDLVKHTTNFDMFFDNSVIPADIRYYGDGTYNSAEYNAEADKNFLFSCNPVAPSQCLPGATCYPGSPLPKKYMPPATTSPSPRLITPTECAAIPGYLMGIDSQGKPACVKSGVCALRTQFPVSWSNKDGVEGCRYYNTLGKKWCIYPRTRANTQPNPDDGKIASCVPPFTWNETSSECHITQPYCDYFQREFCPEGESCTYIGRQGSPFAMGLSKTSVEGPDCYVNSHDSWEGVLTGVPAMILDQTRWGNQQHADDYYEKGGIDGGGSEAASGTADIVYPSIWHKSTWSNTCSLPQWIYNEDSNTCQICPPNWKTVAPSEDSLVAGSMCSEQMKKDRISFDQCMQKIHAVNIKNFGKKYTTPTTAPTTTPTTAPTTTPTTTPKTKESFTYSFKNNLREAFTRKERYVDKQVISQVCAEPLIEHFTEVEKQDEFKKYKENATPKDDLRSKFVSVLNKHGMDLINSFKNRHYILVDDREVYRGMKIQTHAYGEDLHMYSVEWEKDSPPQLTPLSRDIEKICPKCIVYKKYKGNKRKFLKLTPRILKKYPMLHKLYVNTINL